MKIPNYSQQKNMLVFCLTPHIDVYKRQDLHAATAGHACLLWNACLSFFPNFRHVHASPFVVQNHDTACRRFFQWWCHRKSLPEDVLLVDILKSLIVIRKYICLLAKTAVIRLMMTVLEPVSYTHLTPAEEIPELSAGQAEWWIDTQRTRTYCPAFFLPEVPPPATE